MFFNYNKFIIERIFCLLQPVRSFSATRRTSAFHSGGNVTGKTTVEIEVTNRAHVRRTTACSPASFSVPTPRVPRTAFHRHRSVTVSRSARMVATSSTVRHTRVSTASSSVSRLRAVYPSRSVVTVTAIVMTQLMKKTAVSFTIYGCTCTLFIAVYCFVNVSALFLISQ